MVNKSKRDLIIANRKVGIKHPPLVVAEMSGNHNQSLERAIAIVEAAAKAGAHAVKLQTYTAETMTLPLREGEFFIDDPESLWKGKSLYELYKMAYTPWEWHKPIFDKCKELGIIGFSSPFDSTAVDFLEDLDVPAYKISSFENTDYALLRKVAETGKPIIISTGMATIADMEESVQLLRARGNENQILLKCTSSYPAEPENTNLLTIPHMRDLFDVKVGLSDHTLGIGVAVASVALGAVLIEKHFTLSRADGGVDSAFSIEPEELKALVNETYRAWQGLGEIHYGTSITEKKSKNFSRSLYIVKDMREGDVFTKETLRSIRPGLGLPTKYYDVILGKKINRAAEKGTPVSWELIG